ncbi:hypothetical protein ETU10_05820 [Apibacter muscae]|uniref:O-antigen ligase family protein n=1 Tax=Apibacter muscae TaxID=2509004 RepID=UPI0011ACEBB8|nr:O-antigen ligase family protein [Apibacter muscae]TWP23748.1 hypothetical protein ETU10_05820 [Apibacter muscae]
MALIFAVIHIIRSTSYLFCLPLNIESIRDALGRGYILEVFGIYFLLLKEKNIFSFSSKFRILYSIILLTSTLLYFSRINLLILFILVLFSLKEINYKKIYYLIIPFLYVGLLVSFNFFLVKDKLTDKSQSSGIEIFMDKIKYTKDEVFYANADADNESLEQLYKHWRAYETKCALEQVNNKLLGNGFGSLVDLHLKVYLGGEKVQFIPVLHNGYAYVYFKTGLVGLSLYLIFIIIICLNFKLFFTNYKYLYFFQLGIGLIIILTSFVIAGIYGKNDLIIFILGVLLGKQVFIKNKYKNCLLE